MDVGCVGKRKRKILFIEKKKLERCEITKIVVKFLSNFFNKLFF